MDLVYGDSEVGWYVNGQEGDFDTIWMFVIIFTAQQ